MKKSSLFSASFWFLAEGKKVTSQAKPSWKTFSSSQLASDSSLPDSMSNMNIESQEKQNIDDASNVLNITLGQMMLVPVLIGVINKPTKYFVVLLSWIQKLCCFVMD